MLQNCFFVNLVFCCIFFFNVFIVVVVLSLVLYMDYIKYIYVVCREIIKIIIKKINFLWKLIKTKLRTKLKQQYKKEKIKTVELAVRENVF